MTYSIGHGNVALDIARILTSPLNELEATDISKNAFSTLRNSKIKRVHVIGRRGPLESSFTPKEVREMFSIPNLKFKVDASILETEMLKGAEYLSKNRLKRRLLEIIQKRSVDISSHQFEKEWSLDYLSSPVGFKMNQSGALSHIILERNKLSGRQPDVMTLPTRKFYEINCGLVIKSIGYENISIDNCLPFDEKRNLIVNSRGRVLPISQELGAVYVSGWLKSGPVGVIASTMYNAFETADSIFEDATELSVKKAMGYEGIYPFIGDKAINWEQWVLIDHEECRRGGNSKPREKISSIDDMMNLIKL